MDGQKQHFYEFGEYRIALEDRLLQRGDEVISLPPKAVELLFVLLKSGGRVLTKDELMSLVWADSFVEESNLTQNIFLLRKVLGDGKFIETIPRRGYRFTADVRETNGEIFTAKEQTLTRILVEEEIEIEDEPKKIVEAKTLPPAVITTNQPGSENNASQSNWRKSALVGGLAVLLIAAVGFGYWFYAVRQGNAEQINSIAVLPFVNESGNADVEYLSDGMTETLISSLSQIPKLKVKARSSVFRYKGTEVSPQTVGTELNVQAILNGRVVQHGDELTLYLSLVDSKTENQIWGKQYNRKLNNLVALQTEIALDVSDNLKTKLTGADAQKLAKNYTANAEAYQFYLKGRYFWYKFSPADHQKAFEYFNQAIAKDPNYALAYVGLADTYGASSTNGWIPPREGYPKGKTAARKALEIDETLAQAHTSLGGLIMFSEFDWKSAEREYKRAEELNPNYVLTFELHSYLLSALGRPDEAIAKARHGLELDPLSATLSEDVAAAYYLARQYDQAIEQIQKMREIEPNRPGAHIALGNNYDMKGMYEESIAEYQKAINASERTSTILGLLGHVYAVSGKRNQALKILNEMKEMSKQKYVSPYDLAILFVGLGEKDKALEQLNHAYEERDGWMIYLRVEPLFDPLRSDPGFKNLLKRMKLPE